MNRRPLPVRPPRIAERLLRRILPDGVLGQSIAGDLREEYQGIVWSRERRFPGLWYWKSAVSIGGSYLLLNLRNSIKSRSSRKVLSMKTTTILADLRFGARMLLRTPAMSLIAVLTIGLGVAICTQSFSSVYGSILKGLPIPGDDRLMYVDANRHDLGAESLEISIHDYLDLRELQSSFEDLAAFYQGTVNLSGDERPPERFSGAFVSANALSHLQVPPLLGRTFLPGEDLPGASPVTVIAHHVWQNRFAGDPAVLGTTIRINGEDTEIVGIMPDGFRFPFNEGVWLTHRMDANSLTRGAGRQVDVFGRLRSGITQQAAAAELSAIAAELGRRYPDSNDNVGYGIQRYELRYMPAEIRAVMWVMLAGTFGVLLIACANVANLLLARAASRTKEVAIRTALGASRFRVIRQLLVESLIISVIGGTIGFVLGVWAISWQNGLQAGINKPFWIDVRVDLPMLLFAIGATTIASIAAGMLPAMRASGIAVGDTLKDEARGSTGLRLGWTSNLLVVAEITVSCALLVGAGFLIKSVVNLRNVDLGFEPSGVMTGRIRLFEADYPDNASSDQFFSLLKERLEQEPGVSSVALGTHLPALGSFLYYVGIEGESYATDRDYPAAYATSVSRNYFETFGVEFLEGRDFTTSETAVGGDPVTIVNASFVERFFPDGEVLGKRIRWGISTSQEPWLTIVGVVPDMYVGGGVGGLGNDRMRPERFYLPKGLNEHRAYTIAIGTSAPMEAVSARLREAVTELDPNLPVYSVAELDDAIKQATWAFAHFGRLFSVVGAVALFLAAVGLYGVMAFSVNQRRSEMGIRMALGAGHGAIVRLVMRKGAGQLSLGLAAGMAIGVAMGGPMRFVLYGVEKGDISVYAGAFMALLVPGLIACFVPAKSATKCNPVEVIRSS